MNTASTNAEAGPSREKSPVDDSYRRLSAGEDDVEAAIEGCDDVLVEPALMEYGCPPDQQYDSYEDIVSSLKAHANQYGFDLVVRRSATARDGKTPRGCYLACNRYGVYRDSRPDAPGRRPRKTKRQNCPFILYASRNRDETWKFAVRDSRHNHLPLADQELLTNRRPTKDQYEQIESLIILDVPPKTILSYLQIRYPDHFFSPHTISEVRKRVREGQCRSSLTAAFLKENPWSNKSTPDHRGAEEKLRDGREHALPPPRSKRCGICQEEGHISLTCPTTNDMVSWNRDRFHPYGRSPTHASNHQNGHDRRSRSPQREQTAFTPTFLPLRDAQSPTLIHRSTSHNSHHSSLEHHSPPPQVPQVHLDPRMREAFAPEEPSDVWYDLSAPLLHQQNAYSERTDAMV